MPLPEDYDRTVLAIPEDLAQLVQQRIRMLQTLDGLAQTRSKWQSKKIHGESTESELNRQSRECQLLPDAKVAEATIQRLEKRLADVQENGVRPPVVESETDEPDDEPAEPTPPPDWNPELAKKQGLAALKLGLRQAALFVERDRLTDSILATAARCAASQPLYRLFDSQRIDPQPLFGWTVYALAVERFRDMVGQRLTGIQAQIDELTGGKKRRHPSETELQLREQAKGLKQLQSMARQELRGIEKPMVEAFWAAYEQAAVLLVSDSVAEQQRIHLRGLLRHGIIVQSGWLLPPGLRDELMADVQDVISEWNFKPDATHILYADEYIDHVARGNMTPSMDEDLELNERGSELWKLDKFWRRSVYTRTACTALEAVVCELEQNIAAMEKQNEQWQNDLSQLDRSDKEYRAKQQDLRDKMQENKRDMARLRQGVELITQRTLVNTKQAGEDAQVKMRGMPEKMTGSMLAKREAQAMRRACRLVAKLKEPFLPFVTRDSHDTQTAGTVNNRDTVRQVIQAMEASDPLVFREEVVHARRPENRIYARYSPYLVITPGAGMIPMAWDPRAATEVGRMFLPLINARPGILEDMVYQLLSDFRYDTSKEASGGDMVASDTLVAAYAAVRWNYRKRNQNVREKAAIYNEEKDRVNFRRHYKLYISSVDEGGKKLFFKCPECYEAVFKYLGLPEGIERLKQQ